MNLVDATAKLAKLANKPMLLVWLDKDENELYSDPFIRQHFSDSEWPHVMKDFEHILEFETLDEGITMCNSIEERFGYALLFDETGEVCHENT